MIEATQEAPARDRVRDLEEQVATLSAELGGARALMGDVRRAGAIRSLTGDVAHDFNNLLGVIIANLDLLGEQISDTDGPSNLVHEALEAALRGAELTRQLLVLADRRPLAPERVAVNDMLKRLVQALQPSIDKMEIKLDLDATAAFVMADPGQLEASLVNLISNGRDSMPEGGVLMITTAHRRFDERDGPQQPALPAGDYVVVEVGDTGEPLAADAIARILDPSLPASTGGRSGSGLGLIADFARQCGGDVEIYSAAGVGTTIRFYAPRATDPLEEVLANAGSTADPRGSETILVVDDNAGMRRIVVRQLRELGYRVLEAEDGQAALMMLNSEPIQLLFTDVVMPGGLSGYDLARLVLSRWPAMKALITSGFPDLEPHGDSAPQAKLKRLLKPYRKADLARTLREVLDQ